MGWLRGRRYKIRRRVPGHRTPLSQFSQFLPESPVTETHLQHPSSLLCSEPSPALCSSPPSSGGVSWDTNGGLAGLRAGLQTQVQVQCQGTTSMWGPWKGHVASQDCTFPPSEQDTRSEGRAHTTGVQGLSKRHLEGDHTCDSEQEFSERQLLTLSDGILSLGLERKLLESQAAP